MQLSPVFGSVLCSLNESLHGREKSVGERMCRSALEMVNRACYYELNRALGASSKVQPEQEAG